MTAPYVREVCPTCRVEYTVGHSRNPPNLTPGKRCPNGHWHSLNSLLAMRKKIERENNPLKPKLIKPKPKTLKSLGFGGPLEAYQLAATYLLDGYDQALKTTPEGTMARAIIEGAFKGRAEQARQILEAV